MPRRSSSSPYDPMAAVELLLRRLRASAGATRVSVWVHEATTQTAVPFPEAVADTVASTDPDRPGAGTLDRSPFLASVIRTQRPVVARADGRRATDKELAERGI